MKMEILFVISCLLFFVGCSRLQSPPKSFSYLLQAESLWKTQKEAVEKLAALDRDFIVLDSFYNGEPHGRWPAEAIQQIRSAKKNRKVIAYLSIGEAESYRSYWEPTWDANKDGKPDVAAPTFLLAENPDWKGSYKVKYWDPVWQKIVLKNLEAILEQGFDGVYLDIVDGFQSFEQDAASKQWLENRLNPETSQSFRRDMVDWVKKIATFARQKKPGFWIIPQNGSQLLDHQDFLETINAIGIESLFTLGDKEQPEERVQLILSYLKPIKRAKKPIFLIEYPTEKPLKEYAAKRAAEKGLILLLTDRALKTLGEAK